MKRRQFLKLGISSALAATGGVGILPIYKHTAGVGQILEYPNSILRKKSTAVNAIDQSIVGLSQQMITTLRYYSLIGFFTDAFIGRGMAAPQIGVLKRLIVCGLYGEIKVLINPEIIEKRGAYSGYESCLSVPKYEESIIQRPAHLKVRYTDPDNTRKELTATKGYAALLAHEIDHLNGVLYIDHT